MIGSLWRHSAGAPPPLPPPPPPESITVSGAGYAVANGLYTRASERINGRDSFSNAAGCTLTRHVVSAAGGRFTVAPNFDYLRGWGIACHKGHRYASHTYNCRGLPNRRTRPRLRLS